MTYKPIRTYGKEIRNFPGIQSPEGVQIQKFAEGRVNQGLVTIVDPADIPTGALQEALNCVIRYDKVVGRNGTIQLTINGVMVPSPDSNRVLATRGYKTEDGTAYTFRLTPSVFYVLAGNNTWLPLGQQGVDGALAGSSSNRFSTALVLDNFIVANGVNPLLRIDPIGQFSTVLFNTIGGTLNPNNVQTNYRYVTGFDNRVVAAALAGTSEVTVGWSGSGPSTTGPSSSNPSQTVPLGIQQWDPAMDETAGSSPLTDSPSDLSDFITGIQGFDNVLVVLRERSVWIANKQPIPTDPFNFYCILPGIGCNCPFSVQVIDDGLAWLDQRKNTVFFFTPGLGIEPIGRPIENIVFNGLDDLNDIFSSYDPTTGDYTICVPQVASQTVLTYTYNFKMKGWTRGEYFNISSLDNAIFVAGPLTINELTGTIASLQGTIAQLVRTTQTLVSNIFGRNDGGIMIEDPAAVQDNMIDTNTINGTEPDVMRRIISKDFELPITDAYWAQIKIEYQTQYENSGSLWFNKITGQVPISDTGPTTFWRFGKEIPPVLIGAGFNTSSSLPNQPLLFTYTNQIKSRRLAWRIDLNGPGFSVLGYEVLFYPSGMQRPAGVSSQTAGNSL